MNMCFNVLLLFGFLYTTLNKQTFKCIIDRKEGQYFIGRTEFDSPDVDNEVLIDATKFYVKTGEFVDVKIIDATEFDLYGEPA